MERKQSTPSVIARLMGLDEVPLSQPAYRQRVFSDNYLQRTASVGMKRNSAFSVRRSFDVNTEKRKEHRHADGSGGEKSDKYHSQSLLKGNSNSDLVRPKVRQNVDTSCILRDEKQSSLRSTLFGDTMDGLYLGNDNSMRYHQHPALQSTEQLHCQPALKSNSPSHSIGVTESDNASSYRSSIAVVKPRDKEYRDIHGTETWELQNDAMETDETDNKIVMTKEINHKIRHCNKKSPIIMSSSESIAANSCLSSYAIAASSFANSVAKVQNRGTTPKTLNYKLDKQQPGTSFGIQRGSLDISSYLVKSNKSGGGYCKTSPKSFPFPFTCSGTRNLRRRISSSVPQVSWYVSEKVKDGKRNQLGCNEFSDKDSLQSRDTKVSYETQQSPAPGNDLHTVGNTQQKTLIQLPSSASSSLVSDNDHHHVSPIQKKQYEPEIHQNDDGMSVDTDRSCRTPNSLIKSLALVNVDADLLANEGVHNISEKDQTSRIGESSVGQDWSDESSEEGFLRSNCSGIDSKVAIKSRESYQYSPNSVLQPFGCPVTRNLHGLRLKIQILKYESEETYSRSEMAVSSDEDSDKGSFDLCQDGRILSGFFEDEESRDFSYMIDVLDEAGMHLEMRFETCHSLDCPVSLSVFESLEKKYGKQTSWRKSERRLLFDRINVGLSEIVKTCTDVQIWSKSLKRRVRGTLMRSEIEEELWTLLVNQEKEAIKDTPKKAPRTERSWMELEEDISTICREIEEFLFNELAAEFVSV